MAAALDWERHLARFDSKPEHHLARMFDWLLRNCRTAPKISHVYAASEALKIKARRLSENSKPGGSLPCQDSWIKSMAPKTIDS